jgi:hypothetical protein
LKTLEPHLGQDALGSGRGRKRKPYADSNVPRLPPNGKVLKDSMQVHKRTEITVESDEVVVVRRMRSYRGWCEQCQREVDMVSDADARSIVKASGYQEGQKESGGWHLCGGEEPSLVCLESLLGTSERTPEAGEGKAGHATSQKDSTNRFSTKKDSTNKILTNKDSTNTEYD